MRTPILFRNKATADPLQALCPWMGFLEPEIVLNKDGGLLAGFRYAGLDPDNIFHAQVDQAVERMQAAYAGLDGRITVWWIIDKRACSAYPFEDFSHTAAADLDRLYGQSFSDGSHFSIDYFCFILFTDASA